MFWSGLVTLNDMKAKQEALVKEREKQLAKKEQSKELQLWVRVLLPIWPTFNFSTFNFSTFKFHVKIPLMQKKSYILFHIFGSR